MDRIPMAKTILIVEDDVLCMKLFSDLLESHGFNIVSSADGADVLTLAKEHRPALIIMDIKLPEISGIEHIKALKTDEGLQDIPVIVVTGYAMVGDERKIMLSGADSYISKPIAVPHFLAEVKKFVRMGPFRLTKSLLTGHIGIDAEHDNIGALLNELMDVLPGGDEAICFEKIAEITKTITRHFAHEEKVMDLLDYKHIEDHKKEHRTVLNRYGALVEKAKTDGFPSDFAEEITAILVHDMIRADMDFKVYMTELAKRSA